MRIRAMPIALSGLTIGLVAEGVWLFLAFSIGGFNLVFFALVVLWMLVAISLALFAKWPLLYVLTTWVNLIGCALIISTPINVDHPALSFLRRHSVDLAMILFALLAYVTQFRQNEGAPSSHSGA